VQAFTSASVYYQSRSNNALGDLPSFTIDPYKLVDASAGVEGPAATWRAYIWGRNILDQTYSTATTRLLDTTNRFMGRPATFGITVELRY
jgi:outer membrane receptor protein involved in Fe transport